MIITGGAGTLGRELLKLFPNSSHPKHEDLELSDREAVFNFIKDNKTKTIIHLAALTNVRECEENRPLAWQYNVRATEYLIEACLEYCPGVYFMYISTPSVFDGYRGMYNENDIPYPINFYGLTKLLAEFTVKRMSNYVIVRTNFVGKAKWIHQKAFKDRYGTYLFADDVALGISDVMRKQIQGIIHIVGDSKMSMFELAKKLTPEVDPMTINDYQGPPLPMDMSLDTVRWEKYTISI